MSEGLWTERIAYDAENRIQYVGKAVPGSAENALVWSIYLLTYEGTTERIMEKGWADGDSSQRCRWDLRATYAYS